jgi:hypothetical protein
LDPAIDSYTSWIDNLRFSTYILLTQWLPFLLTAFCLLYLMRKPPKETLLLEQRGGGQYESSTMEGQEKEGGYGGEDGYRDDRSRYSLLIAP